MMQGQYKRPAVGKEASLQGKEEESGSHETIGKQKTSWPVWGMRPTSYPRHRSMEEQTFYLQR